MDWKEGLPYSARFGDVYFSTDSGLEETRHVFLHGNDLPQRFAGMQDEAAFCIGETGFGTGLNFLSAWQLFEQHAPQGASLDFFSVEKFPITDDELRAALALWPQLAEHAEALVASWKRRVPGWNRWHFAAGRVRLTLAVEDVTQALPQLPPASVDAWFLDGFSPAKNPEMWSEEVMAGIAQASNGGSTLATYTSAGWVRRGLQQAGFQIERVPGFGRKREMVRGRMPGTEAVPSGKTIPATAIVIGAGIAGCATARALAQRGIKVTLIERSAQIASDASGNPRGILHARFGAGMGALHRIVLASYGHALSLLDAVLPVDGINRAECGLLQLAATEGEAKRIAKLAVQKWPLHLLQFVDAAQASELAGLQMVHGGLWFPTGGWVVPPAYCASLLQHPDIEIRLNSEVTTLAQEADGWYVIGDGFELEADAVVVCNAHEAKKLTPFTDFPLQPVRGQISVLPATHESKQLRMVLCAEGYCTPAVAAEHIIGATTTFDDDATDIRAGDHADNLAKLAASMPTLRHALGEVHFSAGRAGVRCSVPGATPLAGEVTAGLYCSLAHGTRGLLTAGLAAEVIAAAMCGTLPPLPQTLLAALSPAVRYRLGG